MRCFAYFFSNTLSAASDIFSSFDISIQYDEDLKLNKSIFFDDRSMNIIFNDHDVEQDVWFVGIGTEIDFIDVSTMNPKIKYGFSTPPHKIFFKHVALI